ncbi:MAG TPA: RNA polymerase sigma factor [Candidatus Limnocylindrales bacterium]|nr:RNA polymerase sigma factor [Candidatus Limnocylindrales bacterium]
MLKEFTFSEAQQLERAAGAVDEIFQMDEQSFRVFYDRTARPLWSYLYRTSGNATLADDLVQESYYRFLRVRFPEMNQDYMKNYLFRIATNLLRDHWRHAKVDPPAPIPEKGSNREPAAVGSTHQVHMQSDVMQAVQSLKPRERELLWLAYVEGSSHREIAEVVGLREQSIRSLLFRARNKLATVLRRRGLATDGMKANP